MNPNEDQTDEVQPVQAGPENDKSETIPSTDTGQVTVSDEPAAATTEEPVAEAPAKPEERIEPEPVQKISPYAAHSVQPPAVMMEQKPDRKNLFMRLLDALNTRKKRRLMKIMVLAGDKGDITNNEVEKLLRVSDATATRYLHELVRQGRLKMTGTTSDAKYKVL